LAYCRVKFTFALPLTFCYIVYCLIECTVLFVPGDDPCRCETCRRLCSHTHTHTHIYIYIHIHIRQSFPVTGPVWPRGWVEVKLYSSATAALEGGEWSAARPGRTSPPGKTRYPFYTRLGKPQGRSGRAENLVPTGILSRTVQSVVSNYTD